MWHSTPEVFNRILAAKNEVKRKATPHLFMVCEFLKYEMQTSDKILINHNNVVSFDFYVGICIQADIFFSSFSFLL